MKPAPQMRRHSGVAMRCALRWRTAAIAAVAKAQAKVAAWNAEATP
jgi:hypothetical protein